MKTKVSKHSLFEIELKLLYFVLQLAIMTRKYLQSFFDWKIDYIHQNQDLGKFILGKKFDLEVNLIWTICNTNEIENMLNWNQWKSLLCKIRAS